MKAFLRSITICSLFCATSLFGEMVEPPNGDSIDALGFEFTAEGTYIGGGDVKRGSDKINDIDEVNTLVRFLIMPRTAVGILRLGAEWDRYDFDVSNSVFLPDVVQAVALVIGLDTKFSDSLLFRIEATPGFYGTDDLDGEGFNVPFIAGGTYLYSSTLQFVFGVGVNYESEFPVLPGGGVRWKFAPQWVLNAVLPTPRLEYEWTRNLVVYAGADLRSKTVRTDENFGSDRGNSRFNNAILTYTEVRAGVGLLWKIGESCRLSIEGGYLPYRNFDYHRVDIGYKSDGGAPYGSLSFRSSF